MIELITWITDPKKLPDSEECVLVAVHGDVCPEGDVCGEGFHDGERWRWANAAQIPQGGFKAWATMTEGPKVKPAKKRKGAKHHHGR